MSQQIGLENKLQLQARQKVKEFGKKALNHYVLKKQIVVTHLHALLNLFALTVVVITVILSINC